MIHNYNPIARSVIDKYRSELLSNLYARHISEDNNFVKQICKEIGELVELENDAEVIGMTSSVGISFKILFNKKVYEFQEYYKMSISNKINNLLEV